MHLKFIENGTATSEWLNWGGGDGTWSTVASSWSGATASLQWKGPNDVALTIDQMTADGVNNFKIAEGQLRVEITAGPPSGVYSEARPT